MDHINDHLTTSANDKALSPAIRTASGLAKKTLNQYYSRTDDAETYRIAMILHPKFKTTYFDNAKWEPQWIATAKELVHAEFDLNYRSWPENGDESGEEDEGNKSQVPSKTANIFDTILSSSVAAPSSTKMGGTLAHLPSIIAYGTRLSQYSTYICRSREDIQSGSPFIVPCS
ncbi:hypothetical protein BJ165DRAFT_858777 [Panaeolus papilionaceus]|nr:hypothetical protein BJ165DRAFT_858777 [Panaeolus papilionaceus]